MAFYIVVFHALSKTVQPSVSLSSHAMITTLSSLSTSSAAAVMAAPPLYRLLHLTFSRFHGAAKPQFDPDYYYWSSQDHRRDQLVQSTPMADTESSVPLRGVQWAFIGSPHSKKHVYAEMLSKLLEVPHISTASLVRQELSPYSNLYKQVPLSSLLFIIFSYFFVS